MAFEIISQPAGFCLADDIFFYKVKNTDAAAFSNVTWTLNLKDNAGNEYEYQYNSIYFADKTTYLNVSDMVRALCTQIRTFPTSQAFALRSFVEVNLQINLPNGRLAFPLSYVILGQYTILEKDRLPVSGTRNYQNVIGTLFDLKPTNAPLQYVINNSFLMLSFFNINNALFLIRLDFYSNDTFIRSEELDISSTQNTDNLYTINYLYKLDDVSEDNITTINAYLANPGYASGSDVQFYRVVYQNETDNRRVFVFRNKKGGAQVLHTNGTETIRVAQAANRLEGTFQEKDYSQRQNTKQVVYNTSDETIYETSTGYMNKPQFDNITDILYAQDVWLWENDKFVAVEIDNNASEKFDNNNGLFYAKLAWKYAYR
jgi:hypothetical protein